MSSKEDWMKLDPKIRNGVRAELKAAQTKAFRVLPEPEPWTEGFSVALDLLKDIEPAATTIKNCYGVGGGRWKFINTHEDMTWLREAHKVAHVTAESAVMFGNEDSPDRIDLYESSDPRFTDQPTIYLRTENGYSITQCRQFKRDGFTPDQETSNE